MQVLRSLGVSIIMLFVASFLAFAVPVTQVLAEHEPSHTTTTTTTATTTTTTPPNQTAPIDVAGATKILKTPEFGCDLMDGTMDGFIGCITGLLYYVVLIPSSWLARISAHIFDWFLAFTLNSSSYGAGPGSGDFVVRGWTIIRDFCNLLFIFALVYLGVMQVLGKDNVQKHIAKFIIAALLINFSLFFSKVIIDAGNVLGRVLYERIEVAEPSNGTANQGGGKSISQGIVGKFNPQALLSKTENFSSFSDQGGQDVQGVTGSGSFSQSSQGISKGQFLLIIIFGIVLNISMLKIFLQTGIFFLARTIGLWAYSIASPIAFVTTGLPPAFTAKLKEVEFSKWLNQMISLSFMVPVFMFFLYLLILFLDISYSSFSAISVQESDPFLSSMLNIVIPLAMVMFLMNMAKDTAKSMAGTIGSQVQSYVNKGVGLAVGAAGLVATAGFGAAAIGARAVGAKAGRALTSRTVSRIRAKKGKASSFDRMLLGAGRKMRKGSWDVRNIETKKLGVVGNAFEKTRSAVEGQFTEALGTKVSLTPGKGIMGYEDKIAARQKKLEEKIKIYEEDFKNHSKHTFTNSSGDTVSKTQSELEEDLVKKKEEILTDERNKYIQKEEADATGTMVKKLVNKEGDVLTIGGTEVTINNYNTFSEADLKAANALEVSFGDYDKEKAKIDTSLKDLKEELDILRKRVPPPLPTEINALEGQRTKKMELKKILSAQKKSIEAGWKDEDGRVKSAKKEITKDKIAFTKKYAEDLTKVFGQDYDSSPTRIFSEVKARSEAKSSIGLRGSKEAIGEEERKSDTK